MSIIADDLESKCRRIVLKITKHDPEATPATFIGREMALALDHIKMTHERHKKYRAQLLEKELEIGTQILHTEERIDLFSDRVERFRLVRELQHALDQIMMTVQRLAVETESKLQQQQIRLLKLWNMHDQISIEYGDSKNIA